MSDTKDKILIWMVAILVFVAIILGVSAAAFHNKPYYIYIKDIEHIRFYSYGSINKPDSIKTEIIDYEQPTNCKTECVK